MSAPCSTKYLTISKCVIKQAERTGVEPVSDTALISAPCLSRISTTESFPDTAAHHSGVTTCVDLKVINVLQLLLILG